MLSQANFFLSLLFYRLSLTLGWVLIFFIVYCLSQVWQTIIVLSLSQVEKKVIAETTGVMHLVYMWHTTGKPPTTDILTYLIAFRLIQSSTTLSVPGPESRE